MSGPVPQREDSLARPRSRKGKEIRPVTRGVMYEVTVPEPDPDWHPISLMLWEGIKTSGQSCYMQNSDWAWAWCLCEEMDKYKRSTKRSSMMAGILYSAMQGLLLTEGERRRVRIELHAPVEDSVPAAVLAIADYKRELGAA